MNRHEHKRVAEANRNLYNVSPEISDDFQQFAEIPYVTSRVAGTIECCFKRLSSLDTVRVLDVGTGTGHLLAHLVRHVPQENICAIDIAERNIEVARKRFPRTSFHVEDFLGDFCLSRQVDLITCYSVMHHFYDWESFLEKANQLLNPRGIIYVDHEPLNSILTKAYELLAKIKNRHKEDLLLAEYHQFHGHLDPFQVEKFLKDRGYQVEVYFTNLSLIGGIIKKTGIDVSPFLLNELRVDSWFKKMLRHGFLSYKIIAQKLQA